MSLLSAWALAGLALSVPLVLLHLRRRRPPLREVSSLLPWRGLAGQAPAPSRRLGRPALPLLLLLQLLALALLVLSLARPASGLARERAGRIYVVDQSLWMRRREAGGERMALARERLDGLVRGLPAGTNVQIVLAGPAASLRYGGPAAGAHAAIAGLRAGYGEADLAAALALAGGLRRAAGEPVVLLHAPEDAVPVVRARPGSFDPEAVGRPFAYQELSGADARCGLPGPQPCEVLARASNRTGTVREDRVLVLEDGRVARAQALTLRPGASSAVAFHTPAGLALTLRLEGADTFAPAREAAVAVPAERTVRVTLLGERSYAEPLARALAADPTVKLTLLRPGAYRPGDAGATELLVLDRWLPPAGLPPAPALLLVAPPRLPGAGAGGTLADGRLSGSDPTSALLAGVDLTSLTVDANAARRLVLPDWLRAAAWTPEGPLLAAGTRDGQRVAVLAFDPSSSNLPQLASFPALVSNVVSWSEEFAPELLAAGETAAVQDPPGAGASNLAASAGGPSVRLAPGGLLELSQPGIYTLVQRGPWGERSQTIAVDPGTGPPAAPTGTVELAGAPAAAPASAPIWPWVLGGALLVLILEWAYATRHRARAALA